MNRYPANLIVISLALRSFPDFRSTVTPASSQRFAWPRQLVEGASFAAIGICRLMRIDRSFLYPFSTKTKAADPISENGDSKWTWLAISYQCGLSAYCASLDCLPPRLLSSLKECATWQQEVPGSVDCSWFVAVLCFLDDRLPTKHSPTITSSRRSSRECGA